MPSANIDRWNHHLAPLADRIGNEIDRLERTVDPSVLIHIATVRTIMNDPIGAIALYREASERGWVSTVLALSAENYAAVDARPLVNFGLLDFVPLSTPDDPASPTLSKPLFNWLGDEQIYGDIVLSLSRQADLVASRLAADLEEDPALLRDTLDMAMGSWHLALWRLANKPIVLAENEATATILAPVQTNSYFEALG